MSGQTANQATNPSPKRSRPLGAPVLIATIGVVLLALALLAWIGFREDPATADTAVPDENERIEISAPSEVAAGEAFTVDVSFQRGTVPVDDGDLSVYVEPDGPWEHVRTGDDGTAEAVFAEGVTQPGEYTLVVMSPEGPKAAEQPLTVTRAPEAPKPVDFTGDAARTTEPFHHDRGAGPLHL